MLESSFETFQTLSQNNFIKIVIYRYLSWDNGKNGKTIVKIIKKL